MGLYFLGCLSHGLTPVSDWRKTPIDIDNIRKLRLFTFEVNISNVVSFFLEVAVH